MLSGADQAASEDNDARDATKAEADVALDSPVVDAVAARAEPDSEAAAEPKHHAVTYITNAADAELEDAVEPDNQTGTLQDNLIPNAMKGPAMSVQLQKSIPIMHHMYSAL